MSGIATVGGLTVSSARTQTLAGADRALTSRTHGNVFSAQADASMEQESGPIVFRPRVGVAYNAVHLGALDEGLDLGIRTNPSTLQSLTSTVGLRVEVSANPIRGFGELAWSQELLDVDRTASASLVGLSQQTFTIVGERAKRAVLMLRGGVSYAVRPAVSVEVSAGGSPNDPLNGFACNVAVRWHWGT